MPKEEAKTPEVSKQEAPKPEAPAPQETKPIVEEAKVDAKQ